MSFENEEQALEARLGAAVIGGRMSPFRARFLLMFAYALAFADAMGGASPVEIHEDVQRYSLRFGKVDRRTVAFRRLSRTIDPQEKP